MKPAIIPIFCSLVLVSLATAGASHWWSVRQLTASPSRGLPSIQAPAPARPAPPAPQVPKSPAGLTVAAPPVPPAPAPAQAPDMALQKMLELNQKTLEEVKRLSKENRDLRDQMAETNRDLMKLEFRVDTHSQSFRPLPTSDDRPETTLDVNRLDSNLSSGGVLPSLDEVIPLPE
ncbi:hypothetical protein OVA24_09190 [Luteolibacter sp. SL250]|uniref:hypothetical protein n=1 Tax=Luteolibacter sp. SL250 TaxID=2995170 RepID=UPI00226FC2F6|nr:hypothetical protein [Luteolibacter sp. SL250]WAC21557.1 hypothetical protein OVA24_09190 [Luteolibacter sp. SL250]